MLTINELKSIDPSLQDLSDEEITDIRARLYALAELALDCWADQLRKKNTTLGEQPIKLAPNASRDTLSP
jgi:hypothetical protein